MENFPCFLLSPDVVSFPEKEDGPLSSQPRDLLPASTSEKGGKRKGPGGHPFLDEISPAARAHLGEALAAVNRTVRLGLKGDPSLAAAGSAGGSEVLGGHGPRSCGRHGRPCSAGPRSGSQLRVELLLTGGKGELIAALLHTRILSSYMVSLSLTRSPFSWVV